MEFTDKNFQTEAIEASKTKPVLVDFFAPWCGPCKLQGPVVDALATEMGDKAVLGKLNTEEAPETATKYSVMSIPTLMVFKDGEVKEILVGLHSKDSLKEILYKYL
jgi:thioredoxin 1